MLRRLREILSIPGDRVGKAKRVAAAIRETGGYRWVGLYEPSGDTIQIMAWSGHVTPDLGARAEIRTPVLDATGSVMGLLGVERDPPDALGPEDRACLEECARLLGPLWS